MAIKARKRAKAGVDPEALEKAYNILLQEMTGIEQTLKNHVEQTKQEVTASIEQHPLKALGIAALAGFVLGYCFRKNH